MDFIHHLDDEQILILFQNRDEAAVKALSAKYRSYCFVIAYNVLENEHDAEECINDTWLKAWDTIPPTRPKSLKFYVGSITRNLALNKYKQIQRNSSHFQCVLDEIDMFLEGTEDVTNELDKQAFIEIMNNFLHALSKRDRSIFIRRYYYSDSTEAIAKRFQLKESNVLVILSRTRKKLKQKLVKEGYSV